MIIENPTLIFRNFQGKADTYNPAGFRNFCVVLDEAAEAKAIELGYDVRICFGLKGRDDVVKYLKVHLPSRYGFTEINTAKVLDKGTLKPSKIVLAATAWDIRGMRGTKLFLVDIEFENKDV